MISITTLQQHDFFSKKEQLLQLAQQYQLENLSIIAPSAFDGEHQHDTLYLAVTSKAEFLDRLDSIEDFVQAAKSLFPMLPIQIVDIISMKARLAELDPSENFEKKEGETRLANMLSLTKVRNDIELESQMEKKSTPLPNHQNSQVHLGLFGTTHQHIGPITVPQYQQAIKTNGYGG